MSALCVNRFPAQAFTRELCHIMTNIDHLTAGVLLRPLHLSTHVLTNIPEKRNRPFYPLPPGLCCPLPSLTGLP